MYLILCEKSDNEGSALYFMPISPQLQQGLLNIVYFTWLHNSEAIAYFIGIILTLFLQFKHPNRRNLLFFIGFLVLLLNFEYEKHFVEPLLNQTVQAVLEQGATANRFQKLISFFFQKFIPLISYLIGWGSLFLAIVLGSKSTDKPKSQ